MKKDAVAAGIKYLIYSVVGASLALLGIFILSPYVSSFSFAAGGVLDMSRVAGHEGLVLAMTFLMLLGFGTKAGMFPLHGWLPTAHPAVRYHYQGWRAGCAAADLLLYWCGFPARHLGTDRVHEPRAVHGVHGLPAGL